MRFLILCSAAETSEDVLGGPVLFRPDLRAADDGTVAAALRAIRPNAVVTDRALGPESLREWRSAMADEPVVVVRCGRPKSPSKSPSKRPRSRTSRPKAAPGRDAAGYGVPVIAVRPKRGLGAVAPSSARVSEEMLVRALGVAERFLQRRERAGAPAGPARPARHARPVRRRRAEPESVVLVGAGIVNLVTAHTLQTAGYDVSVLEAGPDPRDGAPWHAYGATRGGGNARMFTLTEMDDYHPKSLSDVASSVVFDRTAEQGGWDVRRRSKPADPGPGTGSRAGPDAGPHAETAWVRDFKSVPPWLARTYNEDIFGLNRRSGHLWERWLADRPELFEHVRLRHGILRLYEDAGQLEQSARRQVAVGAMIARYRAQEVRERFPALAGAVPDAFAGGIMVRGFTLTVHDFMARLLASLEAGGARLHFGRRVHRILRDSHDRVSGVLTEDGVHRGEHYVVSPGVTGRALARDASASALTLVHGVLGCWTTLPDLAPGLGHSLKVGRLGHLTEDANITVGRDETGDRVLIVGSGYGWTGSDPHNIDERHLELVHAAIADTARRLFPAAYEAAGGERGLLPTRRHCVRPWTASNLGLFDQSPAEDGVMVLTGGHNTGGFAQAPVIAEAVLSALRGRPHPMHTLYHPHRRHRVLGPAVADPREEAG